MLGLAVLALVGCGGDDGSDEEQAAERLEEALAAHAEGNTDEAVEGYEAVLEQEPGNQYALYNLGLIDQQEGRATEAEGRYRAAVETDANFVPALFNLAILRTEADPAEAEALYRSVLNLRPDDASAHLNLGFLLLDQGREPEGRRQLDLAVEIDPTLTSRIPDGDAEEPDDEPAAADDGTTTTTDAP